MGLMIGGAVLVGWALVYARRMAGDPDPNRQYDAPDLAERRGTSSATSLNRRNCPHDGLVMVLRDGREACSDCGLILR